MAEGRGDQARLTGTRASAGRAAARVPSASARLTSVQLLITATAMIATAESAATEKNIVARIWSIIGSHPLRA